MSRPRSHGSRRRRRASATSTVSGRGAGSRAAVAGGGRSAARASEEAHIAARAKLEASRAPLADADRRVQRLETEARTISKIVNGETKNLWPPIIDGVHVAKGYEKALGAALGDDLDAPVDPSAPLRWSQAGSSDGDPALPAGRRVACRPCRGAGRTAAPPAPDRRGQPRARAEPRCTVEERPAARFAGRRPVALGRLYRRSACADRRGATAGRARAPGRHRSRAGERAGPTPQARRLDSGNRRSRIEGCGGGRTDRRARAGAAPSARRTPRASATPTPSARSTAMPRATRRSRKRARA